MIQRHITLLVAASLIGGVGAAPLSARPGVAGPAKTPASSKEIVCRKAVQEFYDWYLSHLMREAPTPAMTRELNARTRNFSAELRGHLAEDSAAAAKSPDEIVGLDFDPFVNSQDPAPRYVARKTYRAGKGYWVEVHGVIEGKVSEVPDVIPELVLSRGHWMFVNFHYPAQGADGVRSDLLGVLKLLREDRGKSARPHGKRG